MPSEVDELLKDYNGFEVKPKRKSPRKRKGTSKTLATEKKPSGDLPEMIEKGTRAYNIAQKILSGKSVGEIAKEYGIDKTDVNREITDAMIEIFDVTAPIFANFAYVSMGRLENIMANLIPRMFDDDGVERPEVIELFRKIYADQKELATLILGGNSKNKGNNALPDPRETMTAGGKIYQDSMDALRSRKYGQIPEREREIQDLDDLFENDGIIQDSGRSQVVRQG